MCVFLCVGPGSLQSGSNSIWAQGLCQGGLVPRTNDRWPGCQGERLRTILSSALQDFNGKINVLVKAIPKQPPEKDVSRWGPRESRVQNWIKENVSPPH